MAGLETASLVGHVLGLSPQCSACALPCKPGNAFVRTRPVLPMSCSALASPSML